MRATLWASRCSVLCGAARPPQFYTPFDVLKMDSPEARVKEVKNGERRSSFLLYFWGGGGGVGGRGFGKGGGPARERVGGMVESTCLQLQRQAAAMTQPASAAPGCALLCASMLPAPAARLLGLQAAWPCLRSWASPPRLPCAVWAPLSA